MDLTTLIGRRTLGTPDPAEVITCTIGGKTFRAGRRTAAHLEVTFAAFELAFPDLELVVAQECFHSGYEPSAGTHDGDGVLDFYVLRNGSVLASTDADYWAVQAFMRDQGWIIWFRHTGSWASRGSWHLHGISNGCPGQVGIYVPGQVADGYNHTFGLKDQHNVDLDQSRWPGDVGPAPWPTGTPEQWRAALDQTIFDYPAWLRDQEDLNIMDADTRTFLNRKFDRVFAQEKATRAAVAQLLDLVEELAPADEQIKARITKSKREIQASIAKVDAQLDAEDSAP